jgi:hypothetical protein
VQYEIRALFPNHGDYGDIHRIVELAVLAEESGWDGFFLWDYIARGVAPQIDPWIAMAGKWPNKKPFRRAADWDGVVPIHRSRNLKEYLTPGEINEIVAYIGEHRTSTAPFDVCQSGILPARSLSEDKAIVQSYDEVGVIWWIEFVYTGTGSLKKNTERIRFGPPK